MQEKNVDIQSDLIHCNIALIPNLKNNHSLKNKS